MKKTDKDKFKVIEAKFKKERQSKNIPRMPRDLSPDSKRWWKKIISVLDSSIILPCDRIALMLLCSSLANYENVKRVIEKEGETYKTISEDGSIISIMRPEVEILSKYFGCVLSGLRDFLCTPSSRSRFAKLTDDITNDFKGDV